jgi:hypothetical protein
MDRVIIQYFSVVTGRYRSKERYGVLDIRKASLNNKRCNLWRQRAKLARII